MRMDNKEFFEAYRTIIRSAIDTIADSKREEAKVAEQINSGRFTSEHIAKELQPSLSRLKADRKKTMEKAFDEVTALISSYQKELYASDSLNPGDITEDIRLLQSGLPLTERDLNDILSRSSGNQTMTVLTIRYANEHGIALHGTNATSGARAAGELDQMRYVANTVLKHAFDCSAASTESVYQKVLGDSSEAAAFYNQSN